MPNPRVDLNFKVPPTLRYDFHLFARQHGMTSHDLLRVTAADLALASGGALSATTAGIGMAVAGGVISAVGGMALNLLEATP